MGETDGTDTVASASRVATQDGVVGNCQFIAQAIQQAVGGDLFAIETVQEYPGTHQPLLDFAYAELRQDARPELSSEIENPDDYSVIFLGYPNWNADLPMPLYTFLETYDLSGKTIIPFVTHGGSGFSQTVSTIANLQPDAVAQASRVVENGAVVGNVEFIANTIQEETGGDLFAIETVQTYPGEHQALLDYAAAEMAANARPELSSQIRNLADYDVIFLGYPIWNADLPMSLYSFLDAYDLSGKTVIPFTVHGGSGFAGTVSTVAFEEPGAQVDGSGFSVSRNSVSDAKSDIVDWVKGLGYGRTAQPAPEPEHSVNVLVAYVSQTGATERVARQIAEQTGGDLAEIQRAPPYGDFQTEARAEIDGHAHPDITVDAEDLEPYDVVFVGYPIWWDEAPAMIAAFLAENDFSGKTVAPFCTSSYSPIDNSLHLFRELASGASVADGLTANRPDSIRPWVYQVLSQAAA